MFYLILKYLIKVPQAIIRLQGRHQSMGELEVVGAHRGEQVGLLDHPANIDIHDHLGELSVVQESGLIQVVLGEEYAHLVFLECASKLVQCSFELFIVTVTFIIKIEV